MFLRREIVFLFLVGFLAAACSPFSSPKPPVVLVLLESFSEDEYLCSDSKKIEGLLELEAECDSFMRFTHTYAPSTLSQPNLASLLTGLELSEHRVFHNGANGLSARVHTLAEEAINYRMRTAFFSGGIPVLHKFGISQGYEVFSDGFQFHSDAFFQPMQQTLARALKWLREEVKQDSFFITLYAPDLIHQYQQTKDILDDERPISHVSNLKEVYESINSLISELKKMKRWKNTHFIVMGMGGQRPSLDPPNPLSGQQLHVPLQIKLAQSTQTNLVNRKEDLISFQQVGKWLKKLLRHRPSQGPLEFIGNSQQAWLTHQSHWEQWMGFSNWAPVALRRPQYLFVFNPQLKVYDSFYDKREVESLTSDEGAHLAERYSVISRLDGYFPKHCLGNAPNCGALTTDQKLLSDVKTIFNWSEVIKNSEDDEEFYEKIIRQSMRKGSEVLIQWTAHRLMSQRRWSQLFELGKKNSNKSWILLSQLNLREKPSKTPKECLSFFVSERVNLESFYQKCQDSQLRRVVEGISDLKGRRKPSASFWAEVARIKQFRKAREINLATLLINDVKNPFDFAPKLAEMYFYLPDHMDYLKLIDFNET